jgi:hypothetical protein
MRGAILSLPPPPNIFMVWNLVKHRDNFTVAFLSIDVTSLVIPFCHLRHTVSEFSEINDVGFVISLLRRVVRPKRDGATEDWR